MKSVVEKVTPGQHLTKSPGPRVLVIDPGDYYGSPGGRQYVKGAFDPTDLADRLKMTVPTVAVAQGLWDVNLNEWDCIVTTIPPIETHSARERDPYGHEGAVRHTWSQHFPKHLSVVCVVASGDFQVLDAVPPEGEDEPDVPYVAIVRDEPHVGRHLRQVNGLPQHVSDLVARQLLPVARARSKHPSFRRFTRKAVDAEDVLSLRPFLLGPDDVVLAGSYERNDQASVWLIPEDLRDVYPWVIEALREWHDLYPDQFPVLPDWHQAADWRSSDEAAIAQERQHVTEEFEQKLAEFKATLDVLDARAAEARIAADTYQRALLTQDGDELAEAVGCALASLGFHVVDMDEHWPDRDRREDLRAFDEGDADWVAIVEVKGAKNGAKETEVQNFGRWAERFILDEHRAPDGRWFVTNHQRNTDPSSREEPFANKPAVITTFAKVGGTVLDTRALFDLVRLVEEDQALAPAARELLKAKPAVLVRVTADDLATPRDIEQGGVQ